MQKRIDELTQEVSHLTKLCDWLLLHVTVLDETVLGKTYQQGEEQTTQPAVVVAKKEEEEEEGIVRHRSPSPRRRSASPQPVRKRSRSPRAQERSQSPATAGVRMVRRRSRSPVGRERVKRDSRDDGRSIYIRWKDSSKAPQFKVRDSAEWRRGVAEIADNMTTYVTRKEIYRIWLWNATPHLVLARVSLNEVKDFKTILADDKGLQARCGYQFSTTPWGLSN